MYYIDGEEAEKVRKEAEAIEKLKEDQANQS
jgi:hypothetical protein